MRYVFAIAALVLSVVLFALGIGQRTFLAGPAEIVYPVESVDGSPYAVISSDLIGSVDGQANVVVSGTNAFAAVGSAHDVAAWVEPFDHQQLTVDSAEKALVAESMPGVIPEPAEPATSEADDGATEAADASESTDAQAKEPLDPRGSDLWVEERSTNPEVDGGEDQPEQTGDQTLRMPVALEENQAILIAADGTDPVPATVSMAWVQDRNTPLAGPFLAGGALFAALGGILYLLAVDHDRRGLGPRRGRKGPLQGIRNIFAGKPGRRESKSESGAGQGSGGSAPRTAVRAMVPAIGLTLALGLSGCSANYWPDFSAEVVEEDPKPETKTGAAPVPGTEGQVDTILTRVATVATLADEALDADVLTERFSGDAFDQRAANYKIREAVSDYNVLPPFITDESLDYQLVQSTEGWPRTIFAIVASQSDAEEAPEENAEAAEEDAVEGDEAGTSPSLALVMRQESPHENFLVSRVINLRGGIAMPPAAPATEGTALLADDLQSLVLEPKQVGDRFATILAEGPTDADSELFAIAEDPLLERSGLAWVTDAQKAADKEDQSVKYSVTAAQSDSPVISLSTGVGGALVTTTIVEERTEAAGDGNWKPTAVGSVTALSGLKGQQESLVREVAHQMLFFVPSKDSGEAIQILGVTSELVGARN